MSQHDPYSIESGQTQYECRDCLHRVTTAEAKWVCPECGGKLRNISVPRE